MIFAHTIDKIMSGKKTQTRRVVKKGDAWHDEKQAIVRGNADVYTVNGEYALEFSRIIYGVGKTYAIQPNRGQKSVGRIKITAIRREEVRDVTEQDAIAEGFASREDFLTTWQDIHPQKNSLDMEVWVIEFELSTEDYT